MIHRGSVGLLGFMALAVLGAASASAAGGYWHFKGERFVEGVASKPAPGRLNKITADGKGSRAHAVYAWDDAGGKKYASEGTFTWTCSQDLLVLKPGTKITFEGKLTHSGNLSCIAGITVQPYGIPPGVGHASGQVIMAGFDNTANTTRTRPGEWTVSEGPLYPDKRIEIRFEIRPGEATSALYRTYEWVGAGDPRYKDPDAVRAPARPPRLKPEKPAEVDSTGRFKDLTGTVEWTLNPDGDDWKECGKDMVIPVGAHIRAGRRSSFTIEFWNGQTIAISDPDTVMWVKDIPDKEAKFCIDAGRVIWRYGSRAAVWDAVHDLVVETAQAAGRVTGTILVMEQKPGGGSGEVWKGSMELTHRGTGARVTLKAGQKVGWTAAGFGAVESLDMARAIAGWSDRMPPDMLRESFEAAAAVQGEAGPVAPMRDWSGTWTTDFKTMKLTQTGGAVAGTYDFKAGRISGIVEGRVLKGIWTQSNDKGFFEFQMGPDGRSFTGRWGKTGALKGGPWNGARGE